MCLLLHREIIVLCRSDNPPQPIATQIKQSSRAKPLAASLPALLVVKLGEGVATGVFEGGFSDEVSMLVSEPEPELSTSPLCSGEAVIASAPVPMTMPDDGPAPTGCPPSIAYVTSESVAVEPPNATSVMLEPSVCETATV